MEVVTYIPICICIQQMLNSYLHNSVIVFDHIRSLLLYCCVAILGHIHSLKPELNDDDSDKKFTIMKSVTDSSIMHKGDNTECLLVTILL